MSGKRNSPSSDTPVKLVEYFERRLPNIYKRIDETVEENKKNILRQDYINPKSYSAFAYEMFASRGMLSLEAARIVPPITAAYLWRKAKVVYQIDDRLAEELWRQSQEAPETEDIPSEFLKKLPFECIYVRIPFLQTKAGFQALPDEKLDGFFVWGEETMDAKGHQIFFETCSSGTGASQTSRMMLKKKSIKECIEDDHNGQIIFCDRNGEKIDKSDEEMYDNGCIGFFIQILLYIISAYNDQSERRKQQPKSRKGKVIRTDDDVTTIDVGIVVGAKLRKADKEKEQGEKQDKEGHGSDKRKAPHMRRAHWHLYWVGPKENQHQELRWIHPVLVNADEVEEVPTKVTPVE